MRVLALDTSGLVVSVAVAEDGRLVAETFLHYQKTHSQTLLPLVADMLSRVGMDIGGMDVLALAVGPGSFTGLTDRGMHGEGTRDAGRYPRRPCAHTGRSGLYLRPL